MLEIVEKFITISGEAPIIGQPIYLVRFAHCNLNCNYCDTPYKNEINDNYTDQELSDDIISNINQFPELKVLFTGGEPLLEDRQEQLLSIIKKLENIDFYIETNGSIQINNFNLSNCFYILDWKSPSSGSPNSFYYDNLKLLRMDNDCIKFVISREDFEWLKDVIKIIQKNNPFVPLYVSPQWNKLSLAELADYVIKNKLPLRLSLQLHKMIWKDSLRGV